MEAGDKEKEAGVEEEAAAVDDMVEMVVKSQLIFSVVCVAFEPSSSTLGSTRSTHDGHCGSSDTW